MTRETELMQLPVSKAVIAYKANEAIEYLIETGEVVNAAEQLAAMDHFIKSFKDNERFIDAVRGAIEKKVELPTGTKIEICEAGVSYDYSNCPDWVELKNQEAVWAEKRKALEERLKTIPAGKMLVDAETGETLVGPSKSSKSTYKVTLKK